MYHLRQGGYLGVTLLGNSVTLCLSRGQGSRLCLCLAGACRNHVCLLDGFVLVATLGAPSFVARLEGLAAVPLYGTIVRALQVLFVSRQDTASRRECAEAIADRAQAAAGEWPRRKLQMQALVPPPGPSECLPQLPSLPAALTHSCRRSA